MYKDFQEYSEAYKLYSDIVSGREIDRKNPSITYFENSTTQGIIKIFRVFWEKNN